MAPVPLYLTSMGLYGEVKSYNAQAACVGSNAAMLVGVYYATQGKCLIEETNSFFVACRADPTTNMNVIDRTSYSASTTCVAGPADTKTSYMPVCTIDATTNLFSIAKCTLSGPTTPCTGVTAPTNGKN